MPEIFNPERYGFCVIGGTVVVMDGDRRHMPTQVWMEDVLNLSEDDIARIPRGYILPDRIQFFVGSHYRTCPDVDDNLVAEAADVYAALYDESIYDAFDVPVYNGVWTGPIGETWPPVLRWDDTVGRWEVV